MLTKQEQDEIMCKVRKLLADHKRLKTREQKHEVSPGVAKAAEKKQLEDLADFLKEVG